MRSLALFVAAATASTALPIGSQNRTTNSSLVTTTSPTTTPTPTPTPLPNCTGLTSLVTSSSVNLTCMFDMDRVQRPYPVGSGYKKNCMESELGCSYRCPGGITAKKGATKIVVRLGPGDSLDLTLGNDPIKVELSGRCFVGGSQSNFGQLVNETGVFLDRNALTLYGKEGNRFGFYLPCGKLGIIQEYRNFLYFGKTEFCFSNKNDSFFECVQSDDKMVVKANNNICTVVLSEAEMVPADVSENPPPPPPKTTPSPAKTTPAPPTTSPPPTTPPPTVVAVAKLTPEKSQETNSSSISNASSNAPSLFFITSSMLLALILAT